MYAALYPIEGIWLKPKEVAHAAGIPPATVSDFVAEYIVKVVNVGALHISPISAHDVFKACAALGLVKAFRTLPTQGNALLVCRVEYTDARTDAMSLCGALLSVSNCYHSNSNANRTRATV